MDTVSFTRGDSWGEWVAANPIPCSLESRLERKQNQISLDPVLFIDDLTKAM